MTKRCIDPLAAKVLVFASIISLLCLGGDLVSYWLGHRGMDDLRANLAAETQYAMSLVNIGDSEGWFSPDIPLRINVECRDDASDWATIRMANEIGQKHDLPVFVNGNCLTHQVVDVPKEKNLFSGCRYQGDAGMVCYYGGNIVDVPGISNHHFSVTNEPQPEGK